MITSRIKAYMLVSLLLPLFFLMLSCASSKQIHPQDVYFHPNADFSKYKKIAIFLFVNQLPEERREGILFSFLKEELEKRGYNVLSKPYSIENLSDLETLFRIRDELDISAIVKVTVDKYEFEERKKRIETRQGDFYKWEKVPIYILDFSLVLDMIETEHGDKVWSSSISCEKREVEENRHKFIRQMIKNCLRTIPNK